jgi:hypothetical protein
VTDNTCLHLLYFLQKFMESELKSINYKYINLFVLKGDKHIFWHWFFPSFYLIFYKDVLVIKKIMMMIKVRLK